MGPNTCFKPPEAPIPEEKSFRAELCGLDRENYLYIKFSDHKNKTQRDALNYVLTDENLTPTTSVMPVDEIRPGVFVIIKEMDSESIKIYRAKIIQKDVFGVIRCLKIDEGSVSTVLEQQIFAMSEATALIPRLALKCRLSGLEFFDGMPHLEIAYRLIKMREVNNESLYDVTTLRIDDDILHIKMELKGIQLVDQIQQFIPTLCERNAPMDGILARGQIVYTNWQNAAVWFHCFHDNELIDKIQNKLEILNTTEKFKNCPIRQLQESETWKHKYFEIPTGVFIGKYKRDGLFYRVKLIKAINRFKIQVEFMDYGNIDIVDRKSLVSCLDIDENLAFIPAQCVKAKLHGLNQFDEKLFWRNAGAPVNIKVINGSQESGLEIEILRTELPVSINMLLKFGMVCEARNVKIHDDCYNCSSGDNLEDLINSLSNIFNKGLFICYQ